MLRYAILTLFGTALLAVGCATMRQRETPLKAPVPPAQQATVSAAAMTRPTSTQLEVLVESEPVGGIVVLNGVPIGHAPQRVKVTGTSHGFCREEISLKVRFLAADTDHVSQTIEAVFTPLDKIPASVHFTPTGAVRVGR